MFFAGDVSAGTCYRSENQKFVEKVGRSRRMVEKGLGTSRERLDDVIKTMLLCRDVRLLYYVGYKHIVHSKITFDHF
jgi:hypothetical protein